jgi:hypothetical protein
VLALVEGTDCFWVCINRITELSWSFDTVIPTTKTIQYRYLLDIKCVSGSNMSSEGRWTSFLVSNRLERLKIFTDVSEEPAVLSYAAHFKLTLWS